MTADGAVLTVQAVAGGVGELRRMGGMRGVDSMRHGRLAGRCIGSQRQRRREEQHEQELRQSMESHGRAQNIALVRR